MKRVNIGIVGCGNISGIYLENLMNLFDNTAVAAVCDLDAEKAAAAAEKTGAAVLGYADMMNADGIQIILNLTTPAHHFRVCRDALNAGKHVHTEKPLSLALEDGMELVKLAREKGLMLGGAPDTFLGAGIQTCVKAINDGLIGEVTGASAFMMCHGHESWHPDPEFYYEKGGGPMFDMGPYYLTALVSMIGPVQEAAGMTAVTFPNRTITSEKKRGKQIKVEVPTHVAGLLRFRNGAVCTIVTTFDVWGSRLPPIEIYGTRGSLAVPDPNTFGGEVLIRQSFSGDFEKLPLTSLYNMNSRGIGVSDMAACILNGRLNNRANGELACHVLEIMHALHVSQETKSFVTLSSSCRKPAPLPMDLQLGMMV